MKDSFYEENFIRTVLVIIFLSAAMFFFGYIFGNMSEKETSKEFSEPVSAVVDGEEMPVVSVKTHGNYVEIITDGNEKIYTSNKNLVIYEDEKYYNGANKRSSADW